MTGSRSRARRRTLERAKKAAGVVLIDRRDHDVSFAANRDLVAINVGAAVARLYHAGADLAQRVEVTMGTDHPDYPGRFVIEAKARALRPVETKPETKAEPEDDCPGCPIAHDTSD